MPIDAATHQRQHEGLAKMQEKIDRIEASAYANAKRMHAHAPRKFAKRSSRSQRVSQVAAWRAHLYAAHDVRNISPFVSLVELQQRHEELS